MRLWISIFVSLLLIGCSSAPPKNTENLCQLFAEKSGWYKHARSSQHKWGVAIPIMMSFIYQESAFKARAKPPRKKILWIIPGPRPASAYGYAQATKATWNAYKKATGAWGADRNDFADAVDFVGWYGDQSYRRNKIAKTDAYHLYLAYHEGQGGFAKQTYRKKNWLQTVGRKVETRSRNYTNQFKGCEKQLKSRRFLFF